MAESEDTMLSRNGRTDAGGKLTARLDIPVSDELNDAIIAMATLHGVPKAELARTMLERLIFGDLHMLRRMAGTSSAVHGRSVGGFSE